MNVRWATEPTPTDRGALFGLGVFRCVTATWAVVVALIDSRSGVLVHPSVALGILGPVLAWSVLTVVLARRSPGVMLTAQAQLLDFLLGALVVVGEWVTYDGAHPLRFGAMWQLAPVLGAGLRFGTLGGLVAGVGLGFVNAAALGLAEGLEGELLAALSAIVLLGVAGAATGAIMDRLRHAEDDLAEAKARERIARTLHDGVLQTLAAIQRRSDDEELVALARRQDRDLRRWIRGEAGTAPAAGGRTLVEALHDLADRVQARDAVAVEIVAVTDPRPATEVREALLGAVSEAVTNANKHASASRVTVFVDSPDGAVHCSVCDDGTGFDTAGTVSGLGIDGSIRAPVESVGGTVEIGSRPGEGTEVCIRVPLDPGNGP